MDIKIIVNRQLIVVSTWEDLYDTTEIWNKWGIQESVGLALLVTHYIEDAVPEESTVCSQTVTTVEWYSHQPTHKTSYPNFFLFPRNARTEERNRDWRNGHPISVPGWDPFYEQARIPNPTNDPITFADRIMWFSDRLHSAVDWDKSRHPHLNSG